MQGDFYEAHEHFEDAWRETLDESREFYRALLHLSGGFFRLSQKRPGAAKKFFSRAHHWLSLFPTPYRKVDTNKLKKYVLKMINTIDKNPDPAQIHAFQADLSDLLTRLK